MAKNQKPAAAEENTSLEKLSDQQMAQYDSLFKQNAGLGAEAIGKEDVRPPRLMLAQAMSPHAKKNDPKYIEGLSEGDAFNDMTGEIYDVDDLEFCVIMMLGQRWVEFDDAGKIVDGNVPPGDPRTEWTEDDEGNRTRVASHFYDYLLWLPKLAQVVTFSVKNKQAETIGKNINTMIKTQPLRLGGKFYNGGTYPAAARLFKLGTSMDKNDQGSWAVWTLKVLGTSSPEDIEAACHIANSMAGKNIVIEREPGEEG